MKGKRKKHSGDKKGPGKDKAFQKAVIAGATSFALQRPVKIDAPTVGQKEAE